MNPTQASPSRSSAPTWPAGLTLGGQPFVPANDRIAVLGAGVMGPGIASVFAEHGFAVDLCDISEAAVERGMATLRESMQIKVELGLSSAASTARAIGRVTPHVGIAAALKSARLVIEAVPENREVKSSIYREVEASCTPDTVVWSNTSTMNVFVLAPPAVQSRLVVAHWFAPPHILPLVEVVGGPETAMVAVSECMAVLRALGKTPVKLEKFIPGFVVNRLQRALGHEAFHLLESGAISIENLDIAVRTSLAPRMQILGLMQRYDFTGLNLSLRNLEDPDIVDPPVNLAPEPLTRRVANGELGVTTGKGFYGYEGRSSLDMQRARDVKLWQVVIGLSDLLSDPKPL